MLQISIFQLVLDQYTAVIPRIGGHDVRAVGADVHFTVLKLKLDAENRGEPIEIPGEPWCEVEGFVLPRFPRINPFQRAQLWLLRRHGDSLRLLSLPGIALSNHEVAAVPVEKRAVQNLVASI